MRLDAFCATAGSSRSEVTRALERSGLGRITASKVEIDPESASVMYEALSSEERRDAHLELARIPDDPWQACVQAALGGSAPSARAARDRAVSGTASPLEPRGRVTAIAALEAMSQLQLPKSTNRAVATQLARLLMTDGKLERAETVLERAVSRRCRRRSDRRLWAELLHHRGRYEDSLRITKSLVPCVSEEYDLELVHIHAKNLMQAGQAEAAVHFLDRHLSALGEATTSAELELFLTRERAAREAGSASRLSEVARIFTASKRRGATEIQALASFGIAVELSKRNDRKGAIEWFERSLQARIAEGNPLRAAEIENSLGIVEHELGNLDRAKSMFLSALDRLGPSPQSNARVVVLQNFASLQLDRLETAGAKASLRLALDNAPQGVLGVKNELLLIECDALEGASCDLLLERCRKLEINTKLERPATLAYASRLEARLLGELGQFADARAASAKAVSLLRASGLTHAAIEAECEELAWIPRERRRQRLARLLARCRHATPTRLLAACAALQGRDFHGVDLPPLEARRCHEIWSRLRVDDANLGRSPEAWESIATCVARFGLGTPTRELAEICRRELGATAFSLIRFGTADTPELVAGGTAIPIEDSLRARHDERHLGSFASLLCVSQDRWLLTLGHSSVGERFGKARRELAERFLALLALAGRGAASSAPATRHTSKATFLDGRSKALSKLRDDCLRVARTGLHLSILGESGTGKDRLARYLHSVSPQHHGPFQVLDCASISESLTESELFGHERGAFTGAEASRRGLLEACRGGVLVLDKPEQLPRQAQAALARALETRHVRRVGSTVLQSIDARIISLTTIESDSTEQSKQLLPQLRYRLIGYELVIPPLRQRLEDLGPLLEAIVREEDPRVQLSYNARTLAALRRLPWFGNVTELKNRVRNALLLATTDMRLDAEALLTLGDHEDAFEPSLMDQLRRIECERIRDALLRHGGHRGRAAESLKISRRWLHNRMRLHEIDC